MIDVRDGNKIIKLKYVGDLFSPDESKIKDEYKMLAKMHHPDLNSFENANEVFAKINELYDKAIYMNSKGIWQKSNYVKITLKGGEILNIYFLHKRQFELGDCYICDDRIIYFIREEYKEFYANALRYIKNFKFADENMKNEMADILPEILYTFAIEGYLGVAIKKKRNAYPLDMVLNCFGGSMPGRHAAWIISRLLNIACYLEYSNIVHSSIVTENCFIEPKSHRASLYGGWWYSCGRGCKIQGVTTEIYGIMSLASKETGISDCITDIESIRQIGRKITGSKTGADMNGIENIPEDFALWLSNGSCRSSFEEFEVWSKVLTLSYGSRKFVNMDISRDDIYCDDSL